MDTASLTGKISIDLVSDPDQARREKEAEIDKKR